MAQEEKDILIHKWLTKQLTETEVEQFDALADVSELFRLRVEEIKTVWEGAKLYDRQGHFEIDQIWNEVSKNTISASTSRSLGWRRVLQIAASVLFIMVLGFLFKYLLLDQDDNLIVDSIQTNQLIELDDGSSVWLDKGAILIYPEKFSGHLREVELKGRAFFEITKGEKLFEVKTSLGKIQVLGTSFQVTSDETMTAVVVKTGSVELASRKSGKKLTLTVLDKGTLSLSSLKREKIETLNDLFWHTREISFYKASIDRVINELSSHFGTKIVLENQEMGSCLFTSALPQKDLDDIIAILSRTFSFEIQETEGGILLASGNCY